MKTALRLYLLLLSSGFSALEAFNTVHATHGKHFISREEMFVYLAMHAVPRLPKLRKA